MINMEPIVEWAADKEKTADIPPQQFANLLLEFKGHRRLWFANPGFYPIHPGEWAVVEADRGEDAGLVRATRESVCCQPQPNPYSVLRAASQADTSQIERHHEAEYQARKTCAAKIKAHHLHMKMIDAEYRLDGLKLTFYFTAEGRVDFRELVRDLASIFRTRIELRQIGARDELKRGDCFGVCGQKLCCGNFLNSFIPITTGIAKSQHLILNPIKLSGRCSRLKCCLAFEMPNYIDNFSEMKRIDLPAVSDPDSRMEIVSD